MTTQNSTSSDSGGMPGSWRYPYNVPPAPPPPPVYPTPMPPQNDPRYGGSATKPPTYLALSIVALFFSFVFGAIGLYFTSQVTQRWSVGDAIDARKASNTALTLDIIGIVLGALLAILIVLDPSLVTQ